MTTPDLASKIIIAPVQQAERIQIVDILRGFALFGILLVNMMIFARPFQVIILPMDPATPLIDRAAEWFIHFFGEGKFYSMFSLLFGLGLTLLMDRIEARGARFVPLYLRRLLVLLCIGLVHAFLTVFQETPWQLPVLDETYIICASALTDHCNLRCIYCMAEDMTFQPNADLMQDDEILLFARLFAAFGFDKIRLTGGEPTVRANVVEIVRGIASTPGIRSVSMTTNGVLLKKLAQPLADAGLQRVNVSIDTLNPE